MTVAEQQKFARDILTRLGIPISSARVNFLYAWFASENTKAKYNPLATTWAATGSTFFNCLKKDGSGKCTIGVRNYPTWEMGLDSTVKTLKLDYYTSIIDFLKSGKNVVNENDKDLRKAFDTWGTRYDNFLGKYKSGNYGKVTKSGTNVAGTVLLLAALAYGGYRAYKWHEKQTRKGF